MKKSAEYGKPAPKWLQEASIFNGWHELWDEAALKRVKGMSLIITSKHTRDIVEKLHAQGVHVAFHVCFFSLQNAAMLAQAIEQRRARGEYGQEVWFSLINSPIAGKTLDIGQHPEFIWVGPEGYPRKEKELVPGEDEEIGARVGCPNTPGFREASLAGVKAVMELDPDGIFIDCAGDWEVRKRCWGKDLNIHQHVHPELNNVQAWLLLLKEIYGLVKSYGKDKVVILNSSLKPDYLRSADATMLESYIVSSSRYRWQSWEEIRNLVKETDPAIKAGKAILALSYVGYTPHGMDEDAFYAYACARLFGYSWGDYFTLANSWATLLYRLQLGGPRSGVLESNGMLYKLFEHGLVVVNPHKDTRELHIKTGFPPLRELLTNRRYSSCDLKENILKGIDVYTQDPLDLRALIPAESGRVFIRGSMNYVA